MNDLSVKRVWVLASLCCFTSACQESNFSSGGARSQRHVSAVEDDDPPRSPSEGTTHDADLAKQTLPPTPSEADTGTGGPGSELDTGDNSELVQQQFLGASIKAQRMVDIIFAVDTSGSMADEKATLEATMGKFFATFEAEAKTLDYHVYLIGQNFVFPQSADKITKIEQPVSSNDALIILQNFFAGAINNPLPLRPDGLKEIVVITDDNAIGDRGAAFKSYILSNPILSGKTKLNGFVGLPTSTPSATCQLARIGQDYISLGMDPELGGLVQDLCIPDWEKLLKNLAQRIIERVPGATFALDPPADPNHEIVIAVDGIPVGPEIAKYEPVWKTIVFAVGQEPGDGTVIDVTYMPLP